MSTFDDVKENKLCSQLKEGLGPSFASCSRIILDFTESIFPIQHHPRLKVEPFKDCGKVDFHVEYLI